MSKAKEQGIGLADAISMLRAEVLSAHAESMSSPVQLPVKEMTVELKVAATKSADGRAGFCVPFVNLELGGDVGWQRESMQTVTVTFGSPVDSDDNPLKVNSATDDPKG
ncbi:MAG TPA: trypco2 family protein [Streptosporangiaceae bacterium]|nr:trypco2 family protein [Streptosporangiaceae bacterium]